MKAEEHIKQKIDNTFMAINAIETVSVSPFFKDKTMQRLFVDKEVVTNSWSWFTPKLQLATLACVVVINVYAIQQMNSLKYETAISSFSEEFGISTEDKPSFFNL